MLITGATGFIGSRLASLALECGYSVRTLTRSDWSGEPDVACENRHFGSLPEEVPPEAFQEVDIVVHCAADVRSDEKTARAVNVEGTVELARTAAAAGVETFVFLSSQSARSDAPSSYGRTKFAAERELLAITDVGIVILRPGLVTGPGRKGLFGRMCRLVESLPVIPVLGSAASTVQPIHVDDLCEAIFRCDRNAEVRGKVLNLGAIDPIPLSEFLCEIARVRLGRSKPRVFPIPVAPIEVAVRFAERLRIPLPVTSNNLKGLRIVERMETRTDLARLDLTLRPIPEMIRDDFRSEDRRPPAARILLVGGGRIGLVHAVTLSRMPDAILSGVVDPKPAAASFLRGLGLSVPMHRSLDEALSAGSVDGAVIATPVSTHLPLTRACLAAGLTVMVEKPLAIRREQLELYERLGEANPRLPIQVGYVMVRNPQIFSFLDDLRSGVLGRVRGFEGFSLLSFIQQPASGRWETDPAISGGGAYINAGSHVVSLIHAAFGSPKRVTAETLRLHSADVEDSISVRLDYGEFTGTHYCSWSIGGFPRQENTLVIRTDAGRLILTGSVGVFVRDDGRLSVRHQLDFDVGFNIAPDYAGAGFTTELADLVRSCHTRRPPPMNLDQACRIERLLFDVYDASERVERFSTAGGFTARVDATSPDGPVRLEDRFDSIAAHPPRRVLDLRDVPLRDAQMDVADSLSGGEWSEVEILPGQIRNLAKLRNDSRLRVTVPDFLNQSRLLSMGRYASVLKAMQPAGILAAVRSAAAALPGERRATFWVAAMGLLGAALNAVGSEFRGTLLLHSYLTDLALSVRRLDMIERMITMCRRHCGAARVGFHTNMVGESAAALRRLQVSIDHVSFLTSPHAVGMAESLRKLRELAGSRLELTAEVGLAPAVVHRTALADPWSWTFGADAVLIGPAAEARLAAEQRRNRERHWADAFPGLPAPDSLP